MSIATQFLSLCVCFYIDYTGTVMNLRKKEEIFRLRVSDCLFCLIEDRSPITLLLRGPRVIRLLNSGTFTPRAISYTLETASRKEL